MMCFVEFTVRALCYTVHTHGSPFRALLQSAVRQARAQAHAHAHIYINAHSLYEIIHKSLHLTSRCIFITRYIGVKIVLLEKITKWLFDGSRSETGRALDEELASLGYTWAIHRLI